MRRSGRLSGPFVPLSLSLRRPAPACSALPELMVHLRLIAVAFARVPPDMSTDFHDCNGKREALVVERRPRRRRPAFGRVGGRSGVTGGFAPPLWAWRGPDVSLWRAIASGKYRGACGILPQRGSAVRGGIGRGGSRSAQRGSSFGAVCRRAAARRISLRAGGREPPPWRGARRLS